MATKFYFTVNQVKNACTKVGLDFLECGFHEVLIPASENVVYKFADLFGIGSVVEPASVERIETSLQKLKEDYQNTGMVIVEYTYTAGPKYLSEVSPLEFFFAEE